MLCKSIDGIFFIECQHEPVARDFGNDARRGNAETQAVAAHKRGLLDGERLHRKPVNQDMLGLLRQPRNCTAHSFVRGTEDIQPVDFVGFYDREVPQDRGVCGEFFKKHIAFSMCEPFGVRQNRVRIVGRQNHRRSDYRSGERSPARFIDSRYKTQTPLTKIIFMSEAANL